LALGIVPGDGTEALQRCGEYTYEQGELRGIVGEERRGEVRKWTDVPLQILRVFSLDFPWLDKCCVLVLP
jgi:hypothetical protein